MLVPVPTATSGAEAPSASLKPDSAAIAMSVASQLAPSQQQHYSVNGTQAHPMYSIQLSHSGSPPFSAGMQHPGMLHTGVHPAYGVPTFGAPQGMPLNMHMPPHYAYSMQYSSQYPMQHAVPGQGYMPLPQFPAHAVTSAHNVALATAGTPQAYVPGTAPVVGSVLAEFPVQKPGPALQFGSDPQGPPGANLFIFHLPNDMTNMDLLHYFAPFGTVVSARIIVDRATGRSRGFGFVSFSQAEFATTAIQRLDGMRIGHKRLKVTLKHEKGAAGGSKVQHHAEHAEPERNDPAPELYAGTPFVAGAAVAAEEGTTETSHSDAGPTVSLSPHACSARHVQGGPPGGDSAPPSEAAPAAAASAAAPP